MNEIDILNKVKFLVGQEVKKHEQTFTAQIKAMEKKLDEANLKRTKEVRSSIGVQQFFPEKANRLSGTGVPDTLLGETGDVYERTDGTSIIEKYEKRDGAWELLGAYSNTAGPPGPAGGDYKVSMSGGPHTDYGILTGAIDGVNRTFSVPEGVYIGGSISVYWQGQTLLNGAGMQEEVPALGQFTLDVAPKANQVVAARYLIA